MNHFLQNTMKDPLREQDLGPNKAPASPPPPRREFKLIEHSLKEVEEVIKAARSESSPDYKHCPDLLRHLWKTLKAKWRWGRVADQWRCADCIPKEEDSKNINQFRTISLLSVEEKVFFRIISQRLAEFLLKNNYIDTSVEKRGIPATPNCLSTLVLSHSSSERPMRTVAT